MAKRRQLPDIMGEALGRIRLAPQVAALAAELPPPESPETQAPPPPPAAPAPAVAIAPKVRPLAPEPGPGPARDVLLEKLTSLRLKGMAAALAEQEAAEGEGRFGQRLAELLDREARHRRESQLRSRLTRAKLRYPARLAAWDWSLPRGLTPCRLAELTAGDWTAAGRNLVIVGPAGVGKTYLACALAHMVCLSGGSALYRRMGDLKREWAAAWVAGQRERLVKKHTRPALLILDDWGMETWEEEEAAGLLDILEGRCGRAATVAVSQTPLAAGSGPARDPSLSAALLDRLMGPAVTLELLGESQRPRFCGPEL
ncbi:MAG: ATP-binding protein [Deltaproteobacteria bacterium]|nr:ATP-binding protein [Deltaproteobacteria bacterium]